MSVHVFCQMGKNVKLKNFTLRITLTVSCPVLDHRRSFTYSSFFDFQIVPKKAICFWNQYNTVECTVYLKMLNSTSVASVSIPPPCKLGYLSGI